MNSPLKPSAANELDAVSALTEISSFADRVIDRLSVLNNTYLQELRANEIDLDTFRASQEQFYFAVLHFARPMALLLSRLPDPAQRLDLLENIVEEHGNFDSNKFHEATFRQFLKSIGSDLDPRTNARCGVAVRAFNTALDGVCSQAPLETAVACLGIIEYAFADISAAIGGIAIDRGWVSGELIHYGLHANIDKRHARELFAIVDDRWDQTAGKQLIAEGLELGAYLFARLYEDLIAD